MSAMLYNHNPSFTYYEVLESAKSLVEKNKEKNRVLELKVNRSIWTIQNIEKLSSDIPLNLANFLNKEDGNHAKMEKELIKTKVAQNRLKIDEKGPLLPQSLRLSAHQISLLQKHKCNLKFYEYKKADLILKMEALENLVFKTENSLDENKTVLNNYLRKRS